MICQGLGSGSGRLGQHSSAGCKPFADRGVAIEIHLMMHDAHLHARTDLCDQSILGSHCEQGCRR